MNLHRLALTLAVLAASLCLGAGGVNRTLDVWNGVRPSMRAFGMTEGAPNMTVYAVSEDRAGRLWVGTQDGSALYNGSSWINLNLPAESSTQWVRAVLETPDGAHWFGTEGAGLWCQRDGRWTQYRLGAGFPSNMVNALWLQESEDGWSLWVCTSNGGVARLHKGVWTFMDQRDGLPSNSVWKIRELSGKDGSKVLWAATTKGLARLEGGRWHALTWGGWPQVDTNDITQIRHPDGSSEYWVSTWGRGMVRYDGKQWTEFSPATGRFPSYFAISALLAPDPQGRPVLWVGTYDRGVAWYSEGRWRSLDTKRGLQANGIYSLFAPHLGKPTIWMGMRGGGLMSLDLSGWYNLDQQMGLPSDEIHAFAEARDAKGEWTFWVGTSEGLARWSESGWKVETRKHGLPHDHIESLLAVDGPRGPELWAGTLKGLAKATAKGWAVPPEARPLAEHRVFCLLQATNGRGRPVLWAGTEVGLYRMEEGHTTLITPEDGLPGLQIYALALTLDPDGGQSLWVGTRGYGIGRLKDGTWKRYAEAEGLKNLSVFGFHEIQGLDGRRWLWAGTFGGGAARFSLDDPQTKRWEAFTIQNLSGLPSNVIVRIEPDRTGRVYLMTQRGVARLSFLDPADRARPTQVETFRTGDGVYPVSTNYGASLLDHQGRLWVATHRGVAVLDPSLEAPPPPLPTLVLDRVLVGGQPFQLDPKGVVFSHRQKHLAFEVGLPVFTREEDVRYRSQLVGLEPEPTAWGANPRREVLALPAGRFVLRVEAMDHLGRKARPLEYPITVRPAPWQSAWAYGLYLFLLGWGLVALYRFRTKFLRARNLILEGKVQEATSALEQKNKDLQRLNEERSLFMGIAAHDLRNPLNAVVLAAREIAENADDPKGRVHFARMIERAGRHMGDLIKTMLDVNRIDSGGLEVNFQALDLAALAKDICAGFQAPAEGKGLALTLEAPDRLMVWGDPLLMNDVLENFVSNAVKFTRPGPPTRHVWVRLREEGGRASLEVQDEGPGFSESDKARLFGRFARLSARPTGGEGSSGLGLSIVKHLVEAMGGSIELESEAGHGATFRARFRLPEST